MKLNRILTYSLTILLFAFSSQVFANRQVSGYVCTVGYTAQRNVTFGMDGYVTVTLYRGTNCSGSFVGVFRFYSVNASGLGYEFSQPERRTLYLSMVHAAQHGSWVSLFVSTTNGVWHTSIRAG